MTKQEKALFKALENVDFASCQKLIQDGVNANIRNQFEETPLHCAIRMCFLKSAKEFVQFLLKNGANPNVAKDDGDIPLHFAVGFGYKGVVSLLLKAGADPNIQNMDGETPLHRCDDSGIAKALLKAGADPNIQNKRGNTPLMLASDGLHEEMKTLFAEYETKHLTKALEDAPKPLPSKSQIRM